MKREFLFAKTATSYASLAMRIRNTCSLSKSWMDSGSGAISQS